jgi:uncharacterized protein DUF2252
VPSFRVLFDRYQLRDVALRVVGVGSVGTYCEAALFTDDLEEPLFLQLKEAAPRYWSNTPARVGSPITASVWWWANA